MAYFGVADLVVQDAEEARQAAAQAATQAAEAQTARKAALVQKWRTGYEARRAAGQNVDDGSTALPTWLLVVGAFVAGVGITRWVGSRKSKKG